MAMARIEGRSAVGYARASADEHADNGHDLATQGERIRSYARALGLPLRDIVCDDGDPGVALERPGLQKLLGGVRSGEVGVVVVARLDRLSRSLRQILDLQLDEFEPRDVALVSVAEQFDTSTPAGRLFFQVVGSFAEFERDLLTRRVADGRREKARRGGYAGGAPPLGYRAFRGTGVLVIDEEAAATVRRVFALEAEGLSRRAIAERLNAERRTTAEGKAFTHVQVGRILERRAFYAGEYEYAGVASRKGDHEPIL